MLTAIIAAISIWIIVGAVLFVASKRQASQLERAILSAAWPAFAAWWVWAKLTGTPR